MTYLELLELLKLLTPEQLSQTVRVFELPIEVWGLNKLYVPNDDVGDITLRTNYVPKP